MNRSRAYVRLALILALVAAVGIAGLVWAQPQSQENKKGWEGKSSQEMKKSQEKWEGMQKGMTMNADQLVKRRADMMKKAGVPEQHIKQWEAVMSAQVRPDSPGGIMGFKEALKLTPDQMDRLKTLQDETAEKALALLTPAQKTAFNKMQYDPGSVMEVTMRVAQQGMGHMREGQMMKEGTGMKEKMGMMEEKKEK